MSAFSDAMLATPGLVAYWRGWPYQDLGPNNIVPNVITAPIAAPDGLVPNDPSGAATILGTTQIQAGIQAGQLIGPWTLTCAMASPAARTGATWNLMRWNGLAATLLLAPVGSLQFNAGSWAMGTPAGYTALNDGNPHLVAVTWDLTVACMYIDGELIVRLGPALGAGRMANIDAIGAQTVNIPMPSGTVATDTLTFGEPAVFNRAITRQEARDLWTAFSYQPSFYQRVMSIPNLFAYWRMGEASGDFANQVAGGPPMVRSTGTGMTPVSGLVPTDWDGATDFAVDDGNYANATMPALGTQWSFLCLYTARASGISNQFVTAPGFSFYMGAGGFLRCGGAYHTGVTASGAASRDGQPHLGVVTGDGTSMRVYQDGLLGVTDPGPAPGQAGVIQTPYSLNIAAGAWGISNIASVCWNGTLDEVAAVQRCLTDREVAELWAARNALGPIVANGQAAANGARVTLTPPALGPAPAEYVIRWS